MRNLLVSANCNWRLLACRGTRFCGGFSLVELMVCLTIAAGLTVIGVPILSGGLRSLKLKTVTQDFFSSLVLARSEAIKRNSRVVVCKSADGTSCVRSGGWEQGWLVFHDANNNTQVDTNEVVAMRYPAIDNGIKLFGNSNVANYVSYTPLGSTELASGAFQAGTFTICAVSPGPTEVRTVVINATGRPRTAKTLRPECH